MNGKPGFQRLLQRPLLWALIFGALVAYGLYAFKQIPVEVLPRFNFPQISVVTHEPGATAAELESQIVWPLEGQLLTLPNLISVQSVMGNGLVETDVRFRDGTDSQQDLLAVNSAIDRARGQLPAGAQPWAEIMGNAINEVADYAVQIPADVAPAEVQRAVLANVVPALRAVSGVQLVNLFGVGDEALWIQPDLIALHRYHVPVTAIVQAIKDQVLLQPGGFVTLGHQDIFIEARNLPAHIAELEKISVPGPNGPIPLRDLARVVRAAMPTHNAVLLDGRPAVALIVFKQPGASTVPVTQAVQSVLDETLNQLPAGVHWVRYYNQGHLVHVVGVDLGRNLIIGGVLAVAVLFWVLGAGRGIWVLACSIPLSLLLGIAALYIAGQSLDLMTLGALTVAVGLLADDAIIVLESIYHCWEQGDSHWAGVWRGLKAIAIPDITGTLTTVAVFVPLLFVGGLAGLFFIPFALAMTLALLASLAVSLSFIPLSLGFIGARPRSQPTVGGKWLERLRRLNEKLFNLVSRGPRLSLAITFGILILALARLALVSVNFLPLPNEGVLLESFTLPPGSSLVDTEAAVRKITQRLSADPAVAHVSARIGSASTTAYTEPAYAGEIEILLKPGVNVNSLDAIGQRVQKESQTTGVQLALDTPTLERVGESLSGLPMPFVIHLFGTSISELRTVADEVTARLRPVPSLTSIFNNDGYPVTQLQLQPKPDALAAYGLTPAQLYAQMNPLLNGEVVAQVPEGNVPLNLYMRLADAPDKSLAELGQVPIRTAPPTSPTMGGWTPLDQLAELNLVTTPNQIRHIGGARALDIYASPTGPLGSTIAAAQRALAGLKLPPGYRVAFGGLYPELVAAAEGLGLAALAAFVLMVGILILQFDGLLVPGILLLEIPLALMGGAIALVVTGVGLNATGMVAFLTLIGIGLRHGIVLLDRVRRNEAAGMPVEEAVREGIHVRFRPIVLTALTAILGMLPTALGWGQGAAPEQGLAVVILGGLLWSAVRSTNLIPALYLHWRRKQLAKGKTA
ncbi:MAG TPA: efflux RND transporter permease subunit [Verrucomicrobiae bacterium]|nr:efflux RND transporter permease subunit [Verrucomicrobiae bacterium]